LFESSSPSAAAANSNSAGSPFEVANGNTKDDVIYSESKSPLSIIDITATTISFADSNKYKFFVHLDIITLYKFFSSH